jgi:thioredoxin
MVESIKGVDFKTVLADAGTAVVDFWAPWCGPCKAISPILEDIEGRTDGKLRFFKLDVDSEPTIASEYGIESIPTLLFFKDGTPIKSVVGLMPKHELEKHILSVVD